jgi:hypothetical protein
MYSENNIYVCTLFLNISSKKKIIFKNNSSYYKIQKKMILGKNLIEKNHNVALKT